jgi:predicted ArsR family transcriptional regulator
VIQFGVETERLERQAERYAVLEEPHRREIYLLVRRAHRAITREEVAAGVGVSRNLAAFHLERLLDAGLLTADYARPRGRGGPGAGRPAKRYVPSAAEIALEIPTRRYALAGRLLARAITEEGSAGSARDAAIRMAAEEGRRLGQDLANRGQGRDLAATVELLSELGFEPLVDDSGGVVLANCPFHALADVAPELVCGMNQALIHGLVDGVGVDDVEPLLAPGDGRCCVVLSVAGRDAGASESDAKRAVRKRSRHLRRQ